MRTHPQFAIISHPGGGYEFKSGHTTYCAHSLASILERLSEAHPEWESATMVLPCKPTACRYIIKRY